MSHEKRENETITIVSFASQNLERQAELRSGVDAVFKNVPHNLLFPADESALIESIRDADILLAWRLTPELFRVAKRLKWAHLGVAGVEHSLFPAVIESDLILSNSSGIHGQFMSEWTLSVLYYISQRMSEVDAWRTDHDWKAHKDVVTRSRFLIEGKSALIVGYGEIGRAVAQKLTALGVTCKGIVARIRPAEIPLHASDQLAGIIGRFDIVVIAVPITPSTEKLFNREMFARMKTGSILVNLARGKIIDEEALIEALRNGPLAYAALDVFAKEPLPADSSLFSIPNLLITPHIAGNYPDYSKRVIELFLENLKRYLSGHPLLRVVEKQRGY